MYQGKVAHRDSTGSGGVIGPGDVQWMTAASGIVHEELHEQAFAAHGGTLEGIQLWVNLPKAFKMSKPRYQTLVSREIPTVDLEGGAVRFASSLVSFAASPALRGHSARFVCTIFV